MSNKYPGYIKFFVDTETTGTDRKLHRLFQISGELQDKDGVTLEKINLLFQPSCVKHISDEALEKTGMTVEKLLALPISAQEAYEKLIGILSKYCNKYDRADKIQIIAYNAGFDTDFLREFWLQNDDDYYGSWFWTPGICVMQAAALFLIDVRGALPNFKLETLCQSADLGWDATRAHDAEYDIEKTKELFYYLREHTRIFTE